MSHRTRKYINYDTSQKYGLHKQDKKKVMQPKYYATIGMSYPAHIDISNRAKENDTTSGLALSKPKKAPFYNVAAGMRSSFNDQVAFEVEAILYKGRSSRQFPMRSYTAELESLSLMLNSYYIFNGWSGFNPFFGAGAGISYNNIHDRKEIPDSSLGPTLALEDKSKASPAFQVIFGVSKKLTESIDIQMKVKAMSLGKFVVEKSAGRFKTVTVSGDVGFKYSLDHFKDIRKQSKRR